MKAFLSWLGISLLILSVIVGLAACSVDDLYSGSLVKSTGSCNELEPNILYIVDHVWSGANNYVRVYKAIGNDDEMWLVATSCVESI